LNLKEVLETSSTYTLILYTNPIKKADLELIESYGSQHKTPVVSVHSAGFYSYFKITLPGTFPIVDTHPDVEKTTDLRLLSPWPELVEFANDMTRDIDNLDDHDHGHLPYVVILLHYLEQWRQTHNGENPLSSSDKNEFRRLVLGSSRTSNPEGGEENFQEAEAAVNRNIVAPRLENGVKEIFEHTVTDDVRFHATPLWRRELMEARMSADLCSGSLRRPSGLSIRVMGVCPCPALYPI
jgi:NEDD8-activating enzyme E1 regulatory subunit